MVPHQFGPLPVRVLVSIELRHFGLGHWIEWRLDPLGGHQKAWVVMIWTLVETLCHEILGGVVSLGIVGHVSVARSDVLR